VPWKSKRGGRGEGEGKEEKEKSVVFSANKNPTSK